MSIEAINARLSAYRMAQTRVQRLRHVITRLESKEPARIAMDLADHQDGITVPVLASFALPFFRGELEHAEQQIAAFDAAVAPLLALDSEGFPR